jgi:hypothetical protein
MRIEETVSKLRLAKNMLNMHSRSEDKVDHLRPGAAARNPTPHQTNMLWKVVDYLGPVSSLRKLVQCRSIAKTRENGANLSTTYSIYS